MTIPDPAGGTNGIPSYSALFCDPQVGCSDRVVTQDLSDEHAWQLSQEFRLSSNFCGPFNFSVGGNYLHYETEENYYVFANTLTFFALQNMSQVAAGCLHADDLRSGGWPQEDYRIHRAFRTIINVMPDGFAFPDFNWRILIMQSAPVPISIPIRSAISTTRVTITF